MLREEFLTTEEHGGKKKRKFSFIIKKAKSVSF